MQTKDVNLGCLILIDHVATVLKHHVNLTEYMGNCREPSTENRMFSSRITNHRGISNVLTMMNNAYISQKMRAQLSVKCANTLTLHTVAHMADMAA